MRIIKYFDEATGHLGFIFYLDSNVVVKVIGANSEIVSDEGANTFGYKILDEQEYVYLKISGFGNRSIYSFFLIKDGLAELIGGIDGYEGVEESFRKLRRYENENN